MAANFENSANFANFDSADWTLQLREVLQREPCVVVTMNLILGSAPREAGCRMIVTPDRVTGSIGGGNLEFEATARARALLEAGRVTQEHRPYGLGPALNQCCGGAVTLLFELLQAGVPQWLRELTEPGTDRDSDHQAQVLVSAIDRPEPFKAVIGAVTSNDGSLPDEVLARGRDLLRLSRESAGTVAPMEAMDSTDGQWWLEVLREQRKPLLLFGAGHVGRAVARLLGEMPFNVSWVDEREGVFPESAAPNINIVHSDNPTQEVSKAPGNCIYVVMTHSHQLDEDICFKVLSRGDFAWLGLIGSVTKRRRFVQRLAKRGVSGEDLSRLVCPIGLSGIRGKQPATIALSLVAQLMHTETN